MAVARQSPYLRENWQRVLIRALSDLPLTSENRMGVFQPTIPRLQVEMNAPGIHQPRSATPGAATFRWRVIPLQKRQSHRQVEQADLRRLTSSSWPGEDLFLYGDEGGRWRILSRPRLGKGRVGPVPKPGQAKKVAMLGSLDHVSGRLIVHTSPTSASSELSPISSNWIAFMVKARQPIKPVVLVEDNGPIYQQALWRAGRPRTLLTVSGCQCAD